MKEEVGPRGIWYIYIYIHIYIHTYSIPTTNNKDATYNNNNNNQPTNHHQQQHTKHQQQLPTTRQQQLQHIYKRYNIHTYINIYIPSRSYLQCKVEVQYKSGDLSLQCKNCRCMAREHAYQSRLAVCFCCIDF